MARRADARVVQTPCPLFVSLAEEGWVSGPIAEAIAHRARAMLAAARADYDQVLEEAPWTFNARTARARTCSSST